MNTPQPPANDDPQQAPETLELRPQQPADTIMDWVCRLAAASTSLDFHVTHSRVSALAGPPAVATDPKIGEYLAARLNRAAYLEAALLDMLRSVAAIQDQAPAIATESLIRNLVKVWNGPVMPGEVRH